MDSVDSFIQLRIFVAALGEKTQAGWWGSTFLSETGVRYLSFAFPRAPEIAAIQGAVEAAKRVHDERIGATGVTHLFRQAHEIELLLLDHLMAAGPALRNQMVELYSKPQACKSALLLLAGAPESGHEGPIQIGAARGIPDDVAIRRMAAIYLGAFESGRPSFPYLAGSP